MEPGPPVPSPPPPSESHVGPPPAGATLVFAGSSERDVALAKSFWNSVTLQPPLESRLGPRRMSGGGSLAGPKKESSSLLAARRSHLDTQKSSPLAQPSATSRKVEAETQGDPEPETVDDEKALYLQKAKRRDEIIALLKKQREERIMKEAVSRPHKPKIKMEESKLKVSESDVEDQESVKALI
ncbi:cilia- and flagella-associated protein HOATZ [Eublepharis macularius]|uniref:Cilia- and flagella-associated protein HOATZ n=1 Tax=Eublepharis macularius TaxID=481883 RepID=A0AA97KF46_EUBMA|nr:cilia- and flagella-associated protein HOATZ [Eublepharis macularius]